MQISCGIQGNTRWKQSRYKNVTSSPLCVSVVFSILCSSLPLLCHSLRPSNHIYFHFRPHHLIIKHPRFHFLKWSQCRSASCVGLSLFIPPDELGGLYTVKKKVTQSQRSDLNVGYQRWRCWFHSHSNQYFVTQYIWFGINKLMFFYIPYEISLC